MLQSLHAEPHNILHSQPTGVEKESSMIYRNNQWLEHGLGYLPVVEAMGFIKHFNNFRPTESQARGNAQLERTDALVGHSLNGLKKQDDHSCWISFFNHPSAYTWWCNWDYRENLYRTRSKPTLTSGKLDSSRIKFLAASLHLTALKWKKKSNHHHI